MAFALDEEWWKGVYLCGCEWDHYDKVFTDVDWEFANLEREFGEEGKVGSSKLRYVYVFGATEPQLVNMKKPKKGEKQSHLDHSEHERMVQIPVFVVTLSHVPLQSQVGVKSVMMKEEQMKPMREYRMAWVPVNGFESVNAGAKRRKRENTREMHVLKTLQRRSVVRNLNEERKCKTNYCHPYIFLPHRQREEDPSTVVNFFADVDNNSIPIEFDWEFDVLDDFTDELVKEFSLNDAGKEELKTTIKEEVRNAKRKIKEEREAKKRELDAIPDDVKEKLKETKILKFYPSNSFPNIDHLKTNYINRYFGKADEVL